MAAAGIDDSNVERAARSCCCRWTPTPRPAGSAPTSRRRTGLNVGVVVTDTAGRAWREGQTDIAIGAAGLRVAEDYAGRVDAHGNALAVTAPAVADEIAGAAELAQGKLGGRPFAVVRGRADLVLPAGRGRPGRGRAGAAPRAPTCSGTAPARPSSARCRATRPTGAVRRARPRRRAAAAIDRRLGAASRLRGRRPGGTRAARGRRALAFAHGWRGPTTPTADSEIRFRPAHP